jgi:hypothetical protein
MALRPKGRTNPKESTDMRRIAITAALAGLALLGIGTAATASAQGPIAGAVPALFHSGGAGRQTTDTPSPMASPGDGGQREER